MVEVKNLSKSYGRHKLALDNVNFSVSEGEILGFLGPNGAGKSTTMNIISGYLSSTEGTVTIDNCDIFDDPIKAKSKIGYLPELPPLYLDMTVNSYLKFMFDLKKVKLPKEKHITDICELVKISDVRKRLIKNLSKGFKQRVGLAQALLGDPPVLILDEPTVGLDPKQIIEIRNLITELGKKHTIILSSHVLPEIQTICDRIVVINKGKIIADDTTENLSKRLNQSENYVAQIYGEPKQIIETLKTISGIVSIEKTEEKGENLFEYNICVNPDASIDIRKEIFKKLTEIEAPLIKIEESKFDLEEIFLKLTDNDVASQNDNSSDSNTDDVSTEFNKEHTEETELEDSSSNSQEIDEADKGLDINQKNSENGGEN